MTTGVPRPLARAGHSGLAAAVTALATGGRPPDRSGWIRTVVLLGLAVWTGLLANEMLPSALRATGLTGLTAVTTAVPVLLLPWHPLWGWRVLLVLLALTPHAYPGMDVHWGWPWAPGLVLATVIVLFVVATRYSPPVAAAVGVFTAVPIVAYLTTDWRNAFLAVCVLAVPLLLGSSIRQRRVAERETVEQQRLRAVEESRGAVLDERARIARELHDVVAHHMSVLVLRADSARYRYPNLPAELREEFDDLRDTAREGMVEMRRLLGVLRTESGDTAPQPGTAQLETLAQRLREADVPVALRLRGDYDALPPGVALSAYRIVQEALSNAARHAPGGEIEVDVHTIADSVRIDVRNTAGGPAPAEENRPRHGLAGMRERVAMLGGTFSAEPDERGGFAVAATLPRTEGGDT